jgi:dextranase
MDRAVLREYYDFLVANENLLRDPSESAHAAISLEGESASAEAVPGKIWTIARQRRSETVLHLINLTAAKDENWRNDTGNAVMPQTRHDLKIRIAQPKLARAGWASPDVDHGVWHVLPVQKLGEGSWQVILPELRVWTMVVLQEK